MMPPRVYPTAVTHTSGDFKRVLPASKCYGSSEISF